MTKRTRPGRYIGLALAMLLMPTLFDVLFAKVAQARLSEVMAWSEIIFVGKVNNIIAGAAGRRSAVVSVEGVWRGAPGSTISVSIEPTWPCDSSSARVGQRAIFFLSKASDALWHISHSGHGHMVIEDNYAAVSPMVVLPDEGRSGDLGVRTVPVPVLAFFVRAEIERVGR